MTIARLRRGLSAAAGIVQLVAIVALALFLRPASMGGSMQYVIVSGHSMDPTFHQFDLVAVRRQPTYAVGDVLAYRVDDPQSDEDLPFVIHRVKAIRPDGTLLLRGDNNDFDDPMYPTTDEVVGKATFVIRKGGTALSWATSSGTLAVILGLGTALLALSWGLQRWNEDDDEHRDDEHRDDEHRDDEHRDDGISEELVGRRALEATDRR